MYPFYRVSKDQLLDNCCDLPLISSEIAVFIHGNPP